MSWLAEKPLTLLSKECNHKWVDTYREKCFYCNMVIIKNCKKCENYKLVYCPMDIKRFGEIVDYGDKVINKIEKSNKKQEEEIEFLKIENNYLKEKIRRLEEDLITLKLQKDLEVSRLEQKIGYC